DWVMFTRRSATFVVAVEQLCGNTGDATTLFSAYLNASRRNDPALRGMSLSRLLKIAPTTALVAAAREVLRPQSTQGGLSRRSTSIIARLGSMSTMPLSVSPSGRIFERIRPAGIDDPRLRQLADRCDGAPLRIIEPVGDEGLDRLCSVLEAQLLEPALGNARRAERGEGVAVPLFGDADARPAHTDDVGLIAVVALNAHT